MSTPSRTAAASPALMTLPSFFTDLTLAARRLGYPLDTDAERLLASTLDLTAKEWDESPYKRSHAVTRGRRILMRAVQLALSSGAPIVDGTTMAVSIADDELPQTLVAQTPERLRN
ncbi:MAG: hypothetical protein QM783_13720 [Phycisphaerales bacterium]